MSKKVKTWWEDASGAKELYEGDDFNPTMLGYCDRQFVAQSSGSGFGPAGWIGYVLSSSSLVGGRDRKVGSFKLLVDCKRAVVAAVRKRR